MIKKIQNINNLEDKIKYKFKDINLLEEALTHSSFKNNTKSNQERLEFLVVRFYLPTSSCICLIIRLTSSQ